MSGIRFAIEGFADFREALRSLPPELSGEAGRLVEASTNAATAAIKAGYHVKSGNLAGHVYSTIQRNGAGAIGTVKNTAKHAWIYENGTQARHYVTVNGVQHLTGRMPPFHVFVPAMLRERRRLDNDLADVLVRAGLEVTRS